MSENKPYFEKIVGDKVVDVVPMTFGKFRVNVGQMKNYHALYDDSW